MASFDKDLGPLAMSRQSHLNEPSEAPAGTMLGRVPNELRDAAQAEVAKDVPAAVLDGVGPDSALGQACVRGRAGIARSATQPPEGPERTGSTPFCRSSSSV